MYGAELIVLIILQDIQILYHSLYCISETNMLIMHACMLSHFSCVQLFVTLWTIAH